MGLVSVGQVDGSLNATLRQISTYKEELEKRKLETDLGVYLREAWKVLHPETVNALSEGWYVDAIAEHLQAVANGQINRLIINIPPRMGKSSFATVEFPTWMWTTQPWWKFIFFSYAFDKLATEHSLYRRRLIQSSWYQKRWSDVFRLSVDENMKWLFSNNKTGRMEVVSQATGVGGNCLIIDDPLSVDEARSDTERTSRNLTVRQALFTRLNTPETDPIILIMQRLHDQDTTGDLLSTGKWTHLCLSAEVEDQMEVVYFPVSQKYIVREVGDLLDPNRLPVKILRELRDQTLGSMAYAGQYQQKPAPARGNIIDPVWWQWYETKDSVTFAASMEEVVVTVDTATKGNEISCDVAIQAWGLLRVQSYLLGRDTQKRNFASTKAAIRAMMQKFGGTILIVEDKSNGPAIMEELRSEFPIVPANPNWGEKVARLQACSPMIELGTVFLPMDKDGVEIQRLGGLAPNCAMDDMDALSQFLNWRRMRGAQLGWMKQQAEYYSKKLPADAYDNSNVPTPKELHQEAKELIGMTVAPRETPVLLATQNRCPVCGSTKIFSAARGIKCREKSCGAVSPRMN